MTPNSTHAISSSTAHGCSRSKRNRQSITRMKKPLETERTSPLGSQSPSSSPSRSLPPASSVCLDGDFVKFPKLHQECIGQRWKALGYRGVSSYVTGLIRYDLALGGMHHYFNG